MADARAALARDYEVNSKENSYLLNQIASLTNTARTSPGCSIARR